MSDEQVLKLNFDLDMSDEYWEGVCNNAPYLAHIPDAITNEMYAHAAEENDSDLKSDIDEKAAMIKIGLTLSAQLLGHQLKSLTEVYGTALGNGAEFLTELMLTMDGHPMHAADMVAQLLTYSSLSLISLQMDKDDCDGPTDDRTGFYNEISQVSMEWWVRQGVDALDDEQTDKNEVRHYARNCILNAVFNLALPDERRRAH